jgi:signal peptidase I
MESTNVTQFLANVNVLTIMWFAVALTVLRLAFIRLPGKTIGALVEIIEAALIAGVLVFMIIQPFIVKAFYIPSGSMRTTLIDDDHILVNRFGYRLHTPHHDDVVVFNAPDKALEMEGQTPTSTPVDYIKRLIGLPGDTLEVHGGIITIDGNTYTHRDVRPFFHLSATDPDSLDKQHLKFLPDGISVYDGNKWRFFSAADVALKIKGPGPADITISPGYVKRNGVILKEPYIAEDPDYNLEISKNGDLVTSDPGGTFSKINGVYADADQLANIGQHPDGKIPSDRVVVMGDNRNDSNDSTKWGTLNEDRLVGRAFFIFYPFSRIRVIH